MKTHKDYPLAQTGFFTWLVNRSWNPSRGRRYRHSRTLIAASVMATSLLFTPPLFGWKTSARSFVCDISQITSTTGGANGSIALNAGGTRIAFLSNRDFTGDNTDANFEIFLYDVPMANFTQVTDTTGDLNFVNFDLTISGDGERLAFTSSLNPTGGNADGNIEIFFFDTATNNFTQVTHTTGFGENDAPSISDDGTCLALRSSYDLTGGNADGNHEIFFYDAPGNTFLQVTNTTGINNFAPAISGDFTHIAFESLHNLTGTNADGNFEIFLFNLDDGTLAQVTDTTGGGFNSGPALNGDATRLAFRSNRNLTGANADANDEIFLYDSTDGISQVTNTTGQGGFFANFASSISTDGTRIALLSNRDLTGGNSDANDEIFLYDTQSNSFTQITDTTGEFNDVPKLSGNGTRIAFSSNRNLTGGNADINFEVFLTTCRPDSDGDGIPDDSEPDTVADVVITLPDAHFNGQGNKNAFLNRLDAIQQLILAGNIDQAIRELENLRRRVDGCGSMADNNDWITDCASQLQVRTLIGMLIANLSS